MRIQRQRKGKKVRGKEDKKGSKFRKLGSRKLVRSQEQAKTIKVMNRYECLVGIKIV